MIDKTLLEQVLSSYQADFENLAKAWLAAGAFSYGVRSAGETLFQCPQGAGRSLLGASVPIISDGQTLGDIYVTGLAGESVDARLEAEALFLARLIELEGELENLAEELVNNQDQLIALYDMVHSTRNLLSVSDIIQGLIEAVSQVFAVETVFILLNLPDREPVLVQHPAPLADETLSILAEQARRRSGYFLYNSTLATAFLSPPNIDNALAFPLAIRGEKTAVFGLVNKLDGPFESPAIKLMRAICQYTEIQIESALTHELNVERAKVQTRFQTEMDLARRVQMSLMPKRLPQIPGLDLAGFVRPALSVGGDFYDCLLQPNGEMYFTLGDVSGKGMSAALIMSMTRTTMRNAARLLSHSSPQAILDRSNEALYDDFTEVSMFATIVTGSYRVADGRLRYANAGHAPVIYRPVQGRARMLEATGVPLGVLPQIGGTAISIFMGEGDVLVAGTDGLNEARNKQGELFDYDRLLHLVDALAERTAEEILQGLFTAVARFSQGLPQEDDQTILILKRLKS